MPDPMDRLLDRLLELTKRLSEAIEQNDMNKVGGLLRQRRELLDGLPKEAASVRLTADQKRVRDAILEADRKNRAVMERWKSSVAEKADISHRLGRGIVGYYKDNRNLSSGQLLNKKR